MVRESDPLRKLIFNDHLVYYTVYLSGNLRVLIVHYYDMK